MSGLGVYTHNLLVELLPLLCEVHDIGSITLFGDHKRLELLFDSTLKHERISVDHIATNNPIIRLLELNRKVYARRDEPGTLFYSPTHHGIVVKGVPQAITVHDLFACIFPDNYRMQSYYFKYYLPYVFSSTLRVISDSRSTANDLKKYYDRLPDTSVIHLGVRTDLDDETSWAIPKLMEKRFFLFVGPNYDYKNVDRLIDAFTKLSGQQDKQDVQLVLTGGRKQYLSKLKHHIDATCPHLCSRIIFLGYVRKEELTWLYKNAIATMVTTLYEGFGLPALEAMHCGCPVIASKVASLPEVCGDAAIYIDPCSAVDISVAMCGVLTNSSTRTTLIQRGYSNVRRFSWQKAAGEVLQVLKRVASKAEQSVKIFQS